MWAVRICLSSPLSPVNAAFQLLLGGNHGTGVLHIHVDEYAASTAYVKGNVGETPKGAMLECTCLIRALQDKTMARVITEDDFDDSTREKKTRVTLQSMTTDDAGTKGLGRRMRRGGK